MPHTNLAFRAPAAVFPAPTRKGRAPGFKRGRGPLNQRRLNPATLEHQERRKAQREGAHPFKSTEVPVT